MGSNALLIERALISNELVYQMIPALQNNETYLSHSEDVKALLLLFDNMHSKESDQILAHLGSYYFGEDAGELYECIVLRRGKDMIPYLRRELETSDCAERFARTSPKLCLSSEDRRMYLGGIVKELVRGKGCSDTDPSIDYARHKPLP